MRKKDETLRTAILTLARDILNTTGADSISIREIAKKAGIATGTIYNYFSCKDDLLLTLTEEYWHSTLMEMRNVIQAQTFYEQLEEIYAFLSEQINHFAGMLMESLNIAESGGLDRMQSMQKLLEAALIQYMEQDTEIQKDIWSETFTKEQYAGFIVMNLMLFLKKKSIDIAFFIEIVKRTLY